MSEDVKISELTELAETPSSTDIVPIVDIDAGVTKKVTVTNLLASKPDVSDATPANTSSTTTGGPGTSAVAARVDHIHGIGTHTHAGATTGGQLSAASLSDATATPTASKIVIADANGKVTAWVDDGTSSVKGKLQLATTAEAAAGSDTAKAVTAAGLAAAAPLKSLFTAAEQLLASTAANTPAALTMSASTILARLASGSVKAASVAEILTLLSVASGATVGLANASLGGMTRVMNAASGDGAAVNLGFRPKAVIFLGGISATTYVGFGFATASGQFSLKMTAGNVGYDGSHCIYIYNAGGGQLGSIILSDTGFTISWTLINTPAEETAYIAFLAIK